LAEKSLFIVIARILWGFNIEKKKASDGSLVEPTTRMLPGFLSVPEPFDCTITPRSAARAVIIEEEACKLDFGDINFKG